MTISQNYPLTSPSLSLDFANVKALDSRVTFARASTATYYNQNGVLQTALANVPRFDHDPATGESLGLLVEEQRTNLVLRSEEFDNAYWVNPHSGVTRTANQAIAPDGTLTADLLKANVNSAVLHRDESLSASTGYSWSVYLKKSTASSNMRLQGLNLSNSVAAFDSTFDISAGTVASTATGTASITDVGNGWYRCSVSGTSSTAATYRVGLVGVISGEACFAWGAQLEVGAFPTSYIPTVASQVTRSKDNQNAIGLGQIGEGTFYIESQSTSGNTLITSGGTTFTSSSANLNKVAVAYDATSTRRSSNGTTVTSTAGTQGGADIAIGSNLTGTIKKVSLYPKKLTDANIQALTS